MKFFFITPFPELIHNFMENSMIKKATNKKGPTGNNLLIMLESRLDNTIYRLGLAPTRRAARQMISHKHFLINSKVINIPSYLLDEGDVIKVRDKSKKINILYVVFLLTEYHNLTIFSYYSAHVDREHNFF